MHLTAEASVSTHVKRIQGVLRESPVIAKWIGHADASTTPRLHAQSQDDALKDAAATVGGVVTTGRPTLTVVGE